LRLGTVIERGDKRNRRIDQADSERALLVADQAHPVGAITATDVV